MLVILKAKKQLGKGSGGNGGTTNVLIATREEVIEKFLNKNKKQIEADYTEEDTDE